jgi:hypothetical protein
MKNLVYSIPIDTIEVLRNRVENAATTIRNNRGMLERVEESFWKNHFVGPFIIVSCVYLSSKLVLKNRL